MRFLSMLAVGKKNQSLYESLASQDALKVFVIWINYHSSIRKRGSTTGGAGGAPSTTRDVMTVFFTC